jgi:plastocyanin
MSVETLFYIAGIVLVLSALGLSAVGLRNEESFPSALVLRLGGVVLLVIVVTTTTFAVLNARDEQEKRSEELAAEKGEAGGGGEMIDFSVASGPELAFEQKDVTAKAGEATIELANNSEVGHDVTIEQDGKELGKTDIISKSTSSTTIKLKPGKYTFFCSVPGHREAGMEGTLTVK